MEAKTWFNLSLFNTPRAGDYFEDLIRPSTLCGR